jgi:hypothetical protein
MEEDDQTRPTEQSPEVQLAHQEELLDVVVEDTGLNLAQKPRFNMHSLISRFEDGDTLNIQIQEQNLNKQKTQSKKGVLTESSRMLGQEGAQGSQEMQIASSLNSSAAASPAGSSRLRTGLDINAARHRKLVDAAQRKLREFAESPELPPIFSKQVSMFADAEVPETKQPVATKTVNFDNQNKTNFAKMLKGIRKQYHKAADKD